jgi:beta-amylase
MGKSNQFRDKFGKYLNLRSWSGQITAVVMAVVVILLVTQFMIPKPPLSPARCASIEPDYKVFVMAPLDEIKDFNIFEKQLVTLKNNGVHALTTDIWWSDVESRGDNKFDWSYYKKYADRIRNSGLKWVPILSTHVYKNPLPNWLYQMAPDDQTKFISESGAKHDDALSPWWLETVKQYDELYASFATNFSGYIDIIEKIYLSAGPSGELRYPSYDHAPGRGSLEAYSAPAKNDFRHVMEKKYGTIKNVNTAWRTNLSNFTEINPPSIGSNFFTDGYKIQYGRDFLSWYQGVLTRHLTAIAKAAHNRFDPVFNVRIGAKIAGVHWLMNDLNTPRSAEFCAGYYDYNSLLDQFKASNIDLTFTCLEKDDSNAFNANAPDEHDRYSAPKSLVMTVATLASSKGIKHFGENAGSIATATGYQNCAEMLFNHKFSGFTLLRIEDLVDQNGNPTGRMNDFKEILIKKPVPVKFTINGAGATPGRDVFITGNRWEFANWTTEGYAFPLVYKNGQWQGTMYLGEGFTYEFKAIKKDENWKVDWESGKNKTYNVPAGGGSYTWTWKNP